MNATVTIVDYGCGNLFSLARALETAGGTAEVCSNPEQAASAERLVLPGVGAFGRAVDDLSAHGMKDAVLKFVQTGRPFLGICVGMQMLFDESEEFGRHQGLGLVPGKVVRFPTDMTECGERLKVPHMGWNNIHIQKSSPIFKETVDGSFVYFVHSYYCAADNSSDVAATCRYGEVEFCASVWRDNLMATQFHPEKSQDIGLNIFKNFGEL